MKATIKQTDIIADFIKNNFISKTETKIIGYNKRHKAIDLCVNSRDDRINSTFNCRISLERLEIVYCTIPVLKLLKKNQKKPIL